MKKLNELFVCIADNELNRDWISEFINTSDFDLYIHVKDDAVSNGFTDIVISLTDFSGGGSLSKENAYEIASWFYETLVKEYRSEIDFDTFGHIYVYFDDELIIKNIYDIEDFE